MARLDSHAGNGRLVLATSRTAPALAAGGDGQRGLGGQPVRGAENLPADVRQAQRQHLSLTDLKGAPFSFSLTPAMFEALHHIDQRCGGHDRPACPGGE